MSNSDWCMEIEREGHKFLVLTGKPPDPHYGNFWNLFVADWEPTTLKWIKEFGDPNKSFLDIGAWIGPTSLWASKFYKNVHSYEPDPTAFRFLEENVSMNASNVVLCNAAITSDGEPVSLFSRDGLGSSMTSMYTGEYSGVSATSVKVSSALKKGDFGLIKVDIEGGERLIIDSLVEELSKNPVPLIFSFHYAFFANPHSDFEYTRKKLKDVYSTFILENGNKVDADDIPRGFTNVLCAK